ncbi:hypothetical protein [Enterobacter asburiae]|uniref:hypothetical protein n=1 Tax=Enterobacter asburiae TaxID=61645 RepID=UPI0021D31DF0|nr:hypothetical protein [Enterobacter asburiae]MCU6243892.1 hypothetical protein [Enterobacter asburiae]
MNGVRLLSITRDFYSFLRDVNQHTELVICAHGWRNHVVRNGEYLDAARLRELITGWGVAFNKIIIASCYSVFLDPSTVHQRLRCLDSYGYQDTLACKLSGYFPNVRVVGFIGEVTTSVDNPQAWDLYDTINEETGQGLLEMTLSVGFDIIFNAEVSAKIKNPCRYIEFLNGVPCQQYSPVINVNNYVLTQL